ncbi:putative protein kinase RLK-Pelle-RLCK-VIIa-1 family [Helianthus annuus]|nr:putative protein kinase RLK-Pelle-RLCK-VIIa-1 family [Helianthus annuus]
MGCFLCAGGDSSAKKSSKNKRNDDVLDDQSSPTPTQSSDTTKVYVEAKKEDDAIKVEQRNEAKMENDAIKIERRNEAKKENDAIQVERQRNEAMKENDAIKVERRNEAKKENDAIKAERRNEAKENDAIKVEQRNGAKKENDAIKVEQRNGAKKENDAIKVEQRNGAKKENDAIKVERRNEAKKENDAIKVERRNEAKKENDAIKVERRNEAKKENDTTKVEKRNEAKKENGTTKVEKRNEVKKENDTTKVEKRNEVKKENGSTKVEQCNEVKKENDTIKIEQRNEVKKENAEIVSQSSVSSGSVGKNKSPEEGSPVNKARTFTYAQLVKATDNFKAAYFLGEGGFGKVYKGKFEDSDQIVAIKQLDPNGLQGIREFVVEVLTLSMADHPNLVKLIGYCVEGEHRLLVYEYMPLGSLEDHLHGRWRHKKRLDWNTRMNIAAGAARGLEYLHDKMNPPVIYRDMKGSNILLGEFYHAKLSDFGLAKVGPLGDKTHVSTRVMGTYGYCAPDYAMTGQLTFKSDIYSYGVMLLELITGRKAMDNTRPKLEENIVDWARPLFKDRRKFWRMADPALEGEYPVRGLYQALAIAAMCVQEKPHMRPLIADVVTALNYLALQKYEPSTNPVQASRRASRVQRLIDEKKPDV